MTEETTQPGYNTPELKKPLLDLSELLAMSNRTLNHAISVDLELRRIVAQIEAITADAPEPTEPASEPGFTRRRTGELLTLTEVGIELDMSRTTLYKLRQEEDFPAPVKISARKHRWRRSDIKDWLAGRGNGSTESAMSKP